MEIFKGYYRGYSEYYLRVQFGKSNNNFRYLIIYTSTPSFLKDFNGAIISDISNYSGKPINKEAFVMKSSKNLNLFLSESISGRIYLTFRYLTSSRTTIFLYENGKLKTILRKNNYKNIEDCITNTIGEEIKKTKKLKGLVFKKKAVGL